MAREGEPPPSPTEPGVGSTIAGADAGPMLTQADSPASVVAASTAKQNRRKTQGSPSPKPRTPGSADPPAQPAEMGAVALMLKTRSGAQYERATAEPTPSKDNLRVFPKENCAT
jgi:hypothetical protein